MVELWLNVEENSRNSTEALMSQLVPNESIHSQYTTDSSSQIHQIPLNPLTIKQEKIGNEPMQPEPMDFDVGISLAQQALNSDQSTPQNQICDRIIKTECNIDTQILASSKPSPSVVKMPKAIPIVNSSLGKRFIKCVDKAGKVSLIEMVQDEKNPKLFKMVLPNSKSSVSPLNQALNVQKSTVNTQNPEQSKLNLTKIISLPKQVILQNKSVNVVLSTASKVQATANVRIERNVIKPVQIHPVIASASPSLIKLAKQPQKKSPIPFMKENNKIIVLESKKVANQQPQQSLLKPQISLLKSSTASASKIPNKTSLFQPQSTSVQRNNIKVITVSNLSGLQNKNITVFVPNEQQNMPPSGIDEPDPVETEFNVHRQLEVDLEKRFLAKDDFLNITEAARWLFKAIPLISTQANQKSFREVFPFVVHSIEYFQSLPLAKQRSFEVKILNF